MSTGGPLMLENVCATGDFMDDILGSPTERDPSDVINIPQLLPTIEAHPFLDLVSDMKHNSRLPSLGQNLVDVSPLELGWLEEDIDDLKESLQRGCSYQPFSAKSSLLCFNSDELPPGTRNFRSLKFELSGNSPKDRRELVSVAVSCELGSPQTPEKQLEDSEERQFSVVERTLVLDLLHIFQGCNGTILRCSDNNLFSFHSEKISLHPAHKTLALRMCAIGVCYKAIISSLCDVRRGKCFEALKHWFQTQLREFDLMVLTLEQLMHGNASDENLEKYRKIIPRGSDTVTLHQLECLFFDAKRVLKAMVNMLVCIKPETVGGQLCSIMYDFTFSGDPNIQEFAFKTVASISFPIYHMIGCWIFLGDFEDKNDEFFIRVDRNCPTENMWRGKFTLKHDCIPAFITRSDANLIFRAGKNLNFLIDVCKSADVFSDKARLFEVYKNIDIETTLRGLDNSFDELVKTAFRVTSEQVLKQIVTHENLFEHLYTIKHYILHGQGDFFQLFVIKTRDELMKPARFMNMQAMQETLQLTLLGATHVSSAEYLARISVCRVPISDTLKIWDVFCLEYNTSQCLRQVLTRESMFVYSRVFAFLWQTLRVETVVKSMWVDRKVFNKSLMEVVPECRKIVFLSNILITEYIHFIVQVRYYAMSEAVESEWQQLMETLASMKCLEDLLDAHEGFLRVINIRCLQNRAASGVLLLLESIYSQIFKMERLYREFSHRVVAEYSRRRDPMTQSISQEVNSLFLRGFDKYLQDTEETIGILQKNSQAFIQSFLLAAENYVDSTYKNINLNGFCYRVDFNNFYADRNPELKEAKTAKNCLPEFGTRNPCMNVEECLFRSESNELSVSP